MCIRDSSYLEKIPDGRYVGKGVIDSNGVDKHPIEFELPLEVSGLDIRTDFSSAPEQQRGPMNSPLPSTLSAARVAVAMLAGFGEPPNEGMFRPLEIVTRPGSLFHPESPAPIYLYSWVALQSIEVIYLAVSEAVPAACLLYTSRCV